MKKNFKFVKNHFGFTMTELLVTITILGILSTIVLVSITKLKENQRVKFNCSQNELFVQVAKTYFSDNKKRLPTEPFGTSVITLKELQEYNYIGKVLNYDKKEFSRDSYIEVTKIGKIYVYKGKLLDDNGDVITESTDKNKGIVAFDYSKFNNFGSNHYTNKGTGIGVTLNDMDKVVAYQYIIKKDKYENVSDYIYLDSPNSVVSDVITINPKEFKDGVYTVKIIMYDALGFKLETTSEKIYLDTEKPLCSINFDGIKGDNGWYKEKKVGVSSSYRDSLSGVNENGLNNSSTINYSNITPIQSDTNGTTWYCYVKDRAGNVGSNSQSLKVDITKPSISFTITSKGTGYNSTKAHLKVDVKDNNWCAYDIGPTVSHDSMFDLDYNGNYVRELDWDFGGSHDGSTKTLVITARDVAGNISTSSKTYKVYKVCTNTSEDHPSFGSCSVSCGGGTKSRTITKKDNYLGSVCSTRKESQNCNTQDCCSYVRYVETSSCSKTCGTGRKYRYAYSKYNGAYCPSKNDYGGSYCNTQDCCSYVRYVETSSCSKTCGTGTKYRYAYSKYNGAYCPSKNDYGGSYCNTHPCCTGDKVSYGNWSSCSKTCEGTQKRKKTITHCNGTVEYKYETRDCNTYCKTMYVCRYAQATCKGGLTKGQTSWYKDPSHNHWGGLYYSGDKVNVVSATDKWWRVKGTNRHIKKGCLATTNRCCTAKECTG